jgi:hypothetical protein
MERMFARAQSGHIHPRSPASTAGDQDGGGGEDGVGL